MHIPFSKYHGCGNDFIIIDNRAQLFPVHNRSLIIALCERRLGIGADGLILLENGTIPTADFGMRIFNPDASEAEMCGNGIRCLGKFLHTLGQTERSYRIQTRAQLLRVSHLGNEVAVEMGMVRDIEWHCPVAENAHFLNTGVPHLVIFVSDLEEVDVIQEGRRLRHHPHVQPAGANVNFVAHVGDHWAYRTFERGVEAETLACGTGATAVSLAIAKLHHLESPISLRTRSGEFLRVSFGGHEERWKDINLYGPATLVFSGAIPL